jgi:hypothetical protein
MVEHIGPGVLMDGLVIPEAEIQLENRFRGKDDICQIDHLLRSERGICMSSKISKIIDGVEDSVNGTGKRIE